MNAEFAVLVAGLDEDLREFYEERAGIREFDAGLPREQAECLALLDVLLRDRLAFAGVSLLRAEQGLDTRYVLVARRDVTPPAAAADAQACGLRAAVLALGGAAELRPGASLRGSRHLI